jgi:hypothetical protein
MLISPLLKYSYLSLIVCLRGNAVTCSHQRGDTHCLSSPGLTETDVPQLNARKSPNFDDLVAQWCTAVTKLRTAVAQLRTAVAQMRTAVHKVPSSAAPCKQTGSTWYFRVPLRCK